ncbi:MAG: ferric reductase-like transmembrane domain-containing protein [Coriobacteriales bacterium]|nr:ferric reductase-like transmembrane domain-containing protein [Coriobacteriales bacterium]
MINDILSALISFAITLLVAFPLGGLLKKYPAVFYIIATALVAAHLIYRFSGTYIPGMQVIIDPLQKGYLPSFLLAAVMFCGVFDESSPIRRKLQPIRAELSILSFIFCASHVIAFLPPYLPRFAQIINSHSALSVSLIIAIVLTVLYALLSLLSLRVFRFKMPYRTWKNIQRLAYVMVALLFVHILLTVGSSALTGKTPDAKVAMVVYSIIVVAYSVLRICKAVRDYKSKALNTDKA